MIWLNGEIIPTDKAAIAPNDRGFLLADGLFETFRVSDGMIVQLDDHLSRLRAGMAILDITIPYSDEDLSTALSQLLMANDLNEASMRLTVTRGVGPRGLIPSPDGIATVMMTAAPYVAPPETPAKLMISDIRRNETSPLCNVKALNYLDNILALQQARKHGFDDAILLNTKGNVCCTTTANIFVQVEDKLITPSLNEGALPGVMRKQIINDTNAKEGIVTVDHLKSTAKIFITNSLIGKRSALI